eukprot:TRINITY_DN2921_c0_g1_i5.p1 TRINITY_DN2921_c0_g1~~TRINITY_DN2921_c0_g1_i5.p1  ORF type:complete len:913 (-),score=284.33 TRINITY_DN2921_c0_g1_i5:222-2960(-)
MKRTTKEKRRSVKLSLLNDDENETAETILNLATLLNQHTTGNHELYKMERGIPTKNVSFTFVAPITVYFRVKSLKPHHYPDYLVYYYWSFDDSVNGPVSGYSTIEKAKDSGGGGSNKVSWSKESEVAVQFNFHHNLLLNLSQHNDSDLVEFTQKKPSTPVKSPKKPQRSMEIQSDKPNADSDNPSYSTSLEPRILTVEFKTKPKERAFEEPLPEDNIIGRISVDFNKFVNYQAYHQDKLQINHILQLLKNMNDSSSGSGGSNNYFDPQQNTALLPLDWQSNPKTRQYIKLSIKCSQGGFKIRKDMIETNGAGANVGGNTSGGGGGSVVGSGGLRSSGASGSGDVKKTNIVNSYYDQVNIKGDINIAVDAPSLSDPDDDERNMKRSNNNTNNSTTPTITTTTTTRTSSSGGTTDKKIINSKSSKRSLGQSSVVVVNTNSPTKELTPNQSPILPKKDTRRNFSHHTDINFNNNLNNFNAEETNQQLVSTQSTKLKRKSGGTTTTTTKKSRRRSMEYKSTPLQSLLKQQYVDSEHQSEYKISDKASSTKITTTPKKSSTDSVRLLETDEKLKEIETKYKQLKLENEKITTTYKQQLKLSNSEHDKKLHDSENRYNELDTKYKSLLQENNRLSNIVTQQQQQHNQQQQSTNTELEKKYYELEKKYQSLLSDKDQQQFMNGLTTTTPTTTTTSNTIELIQKKNNDLETRCKLLQNEKEQIYVNLSSSFQKYERLESKFRELEEVHQSTKYALNYCQNENTNLESKYHDLLEENKQLLLLKESKNHKEEEAEQKGSSGVDDALLEEYDKLLGNYQIMQSNYQELETSHYNLMTQHQNLQNILRNLMQKNNTLQSEYNDLQSNYHKLLSKEHNSQQHTMNSNIEECIFQSKYMIEVEKNKQLKDSIASLQSLLSESHNK